VDWLANYRVSIDKHPVMSPAAPLPRGGSLDAAFAVLGRINQPGNTHCSHRGRFTDLSRVICP
jgi:hypothetical protein